MLPLKRTLLPTSAFIALAALGFFLNATSKDTRSPASVKSALPMTSSKTETLRAIGAHAPQRFGKASGLLSVTISPLTAEVTGSGSPVELEALIEAKMDVDGLEYVWLLPEGITPIGAIDGSLGSLKSGETLNIRLRATSETVENRQIHLHVYRWLNGEAQGQMTQYNTVDQSYLEEKIIKKAELLNQQIEAGEATLKMVQ